MSGPHFASSLPMRVAAIDIGTNTILLLVAEIFPDGRVNPVLELQEIPRLGQSVDARRRLSQEAIQRSTNIIERYAHTARSAGAVRIAACGTSALRDAANRDQFIRLVAERTGITVKVLSGREEAALTYAGAVADLLPSDSQEPCAVLDIGGGSTELAFGQGSKIESAGSIDIGAVRLTERYFSNQPAPSEVISQAQAIVREALVTVKGTRDGRRLVAVAGTPVTLASILLELPGYDPVASHGATLSRAALRALLAKLQTLSVPEIARIPQVEPGREDVLLAGALILDEVMDKLSVGEILVSARGLRYGIAAAEGIGSQK